MSLKISLVAIGLSTLFFNNFGFAQANGPEFFSSVPDELKTKITTDLKLVQEVQGSDGTPLYRQIFGNKLDGQNLSRFFAERIFTFDMSDCGGGKGVAACANSAHTMWITQNYVTYDIPQIYRISLIFHESRHTEAEHQDWKHVNCPVPFRDSAGQDVKGIITGTIFAGLLACDDVAMGAYGLQAVLLKNIELFCTNCTEKMKLDGKIFGNDTIKRIMDPRSSEQLRNDVHLQ